MQNNNSHNRIFNPYIIEERQLNITQLDVYSRLMMDRILFLSGEVNSDSMDTLVAQTPIQGPNNIHHRHY